MDIYCVIPASEKNRYSDQGDLAVWGETTLLEWKISQLHETVGVDHILVSTASDIIAKVAKSYGVNTISRAADLSLPELYRSAAREIGENLLLWTNPTSPFLGPKVLSELIKQYIASGSGDDGAVTVRKFQEFLFSKDGPANFPRQSEAFTRTELEPMTVLTNGAYLIPAKKVLEIGRPFGNNPLFFKVNWLSSLEIRDTNQMRLFSGLLSRYFEGEI